jgi:transcriptional regulator with XRE-family HTH domain
MITGAQIRAARAALRWSAQQLADHSGVGARTIKRFETYDSIPVSRTAILLQLKATFETAGVEFIGSPNDRPGIRLSLPPQPN